MSTNVPPSAHVNGFPPHRATEGAEPMQRLIDSRRLNNLLEIRFGGAISDLLAPILFEPIQDLLKRPAKNVRGRLVKMGFRLARPGNGASHLHEIDCRRLMEAVEFLHAGYLAVDDVQDGSKMRRGQPSLHLKYGMPVALNTGNWLYFLPLEIIRELGLSIEQEVMLYRIYHRTLLRAHVGQALDVGLRIDTIAQDRVPEVCLATLELKTGALFALALLAGAVIGGAPMELLEQLDEFGHGFGMALQMFDDLGNVTGGLEPAKRWEDLMLRRPTWVWAQAAQGRPPEDYQQFLSAVHQLPHDHHLQRWFEQHDLVAKARQAALDHFEGCFLKFSSTFPNDDRKETLNELHALGVEASQVYER